MKLLDAKPGQRVWRRGELVYWGTVEPALFLDDGRAAVVFRAWLDADDWQPVETDAEKIARLEAELAVAKETMKNIFGSVEACRRMQKEDGAPHCHCCAGTWLQSLEPA